MVDQAAECGGRGGPVNAVGGGSFDDGPLVLRGFSADQVLISR
jgi:hypothetical protein